MTGGGGGGGEDGSIPGGLADELAGSDLCLAMRSEFVADVESRYELGPGESLRSDEELSRCLDLELEE